MKNNGSFFVFNAEVLFSHRYRRKLHVKKLRNLLFKSLLIFTKNRKHVDANFKFPKNQSVFCCPWCIFCETPVAASVAESLQRANHDQRFNSGTQKRYCHARYFCTTIFSLHAETSRATRIGCRVKSKTSHVGNSGHA